MGASIARLRTRPSRAASVLQTFSPVEHGAGATHPDSAPTNPAIRRRTHKARSISSSTWEPLEWGRSDPSPRLLDYDHARRIPTGTVPTRRRWGVLSGKALALQTTCEVWRVRLEAVACTRRFICGAEFFFWRRAGCQAEHDGQRA